MVKFKHGDIFIAETEDGKYVSGKILLDVKKQCMKPKLIDLESISIILCGNLGGNI